MVALIWKWFRKVREGLAWAAYCSICNTRMALCQGSTTSLRSHLRAKHKGQYLQYIQDQQEERELQAQVQEADLHLGTPDADHLGWHQFPKRRGVIDFCHVDISSPPDDSQELQEFFDPRNFCTTEDSLPGMVKEEPLDESIGVGQNNPESSEESLKKENPPVVVGPQTSRTHPGSTGLVAKGSLPGQVQGPPSNKVQVSNLSPEVTLPDLVDMMSRVGSVTKANLKWCVESSTHTASVHFSSHSGVMRAVQMWDRIKLYGSPISVVAAVSSIITMPTGQDSKTKSSQRSSQIKSDNSSGFHKKANSAIHQMIKERIDARISETYQDFGDDTVPTTPNKKIHFEEESSTT